MSKENEQYKPIIKLNPFTGTLMVVGLIMVIALVFGIKALSDNMRKDKQMTISNLNQVEGIPGSARTQTQKALYEAIRANIPYDQDAPTSGAKIRDAANIENTMNRTTNVHYARFIVDIESVQQSYDVQVEWVAEAVYQKNLSGYPVVISCVDQASVIYKDFDCTDMQSTSSEVGGNALVKARNTASIINFVKLKNSGVPEKTYQDVFAIVSDYFTKVYGKSSNLSLDKESFKQDGNKYSFTLISIEREKFDCTLELLEDNKFKISITQNGDALYSYDSSLFVAPKRDPASIVARYLPYRGKTESGVEYTFRVRADGEYELSVNSCKNQGIKNEAMNSLVNWLTDKGYDIEDFNIDIPDYCDGAS